MDKSYFDIELNIDDVLSKFGTVDEVFFVQDLKARKLFLNADIDIYSVADITKYIMQYNADDRGIPVEERKPILLYINSNGGEVDSGFSLIDTIIASKTPVYTINTGFQYSMGFLIGLAGHKRFATPNARYLMHDGSNFVYGSSSKVKDQMEFNTQSEARVKQFILDHSKLTSKEYDKKLRIEWYMFANEAKEHGFVDCIVGTDCDIDEII